jgi:uncharacterized protein YutE (UPF0331/DUF86 family)
MDRTLIDQKLESLRRCIERVGQRCPLSAEALAVDLDAQDIVALNLTRAVQTAVDIAMHVIAGLDVPAPVTMGGAFDALAAAGVIEADLAGSLKKAVGFRNIAVHQYEAIDWAIVFAVCRSSFPEFRAFARAIDTFAAGGAPQ